MAKDRRTSGKSPHKHNGGRERDARHREDVARAKANLDVLHTVVKATYGGPVPPIRIACRPLAYAWRDPQELAGLVEDQYLARWSAPEMPR